MKLEQETQEPISKPKWSDVEASLGSINPKTNSFFILSDSKGNYVQAAGARLRLIVEYRKKKLFGFRHCVLGNSPTDPKRTSVNYSGGAIALNRNEILTLDDALTVFKEFYEKSTVPSDYILRDVTDEQ